MQVSTIVILIIAELSHLIKTTELSQNFVCEHVFD